MKPAKITREDAACVLGVVSNGLTNGKGHPTPGRMCVEAAVCYAMGEFHDDEPACVDGELRNEKIDLNDKMWSNKEARAKGLARIAIAQLGSADKFDFDKYRRSLGRQFDTMQARKWQEKNANALKILANKKAKGGDVKAAWEDITSAPPSSIGLLRVSMLIGCLRERESLTNDDVLATVAEMMVQACIEQRIPGTRYLYLTKSKKRWTAAQIEKHRRKRALMLGRRI